MPRARLGNIRVNAKLPPELIRQTDIAAKAKKMDRSAFIAEALRKVIGLANAPMAKHMPTRMNGLLPKIGKRKPR